MIELDQLLRETDLCVQGLRKYFWQLVPWLVQEQKINTIGLDQLIRETDGWVQGLHKYFWQLLVPWLVQEQKNKHNRVFAQARALAVKNIRKLWTHICVSLKNWLKSIDPTRLCLFFALAPARALAVKNIYANLEHTNRFLSIIDPTQSCLFFCSCTSQGTSYQKYTQTLNS